MRQTCRSFAVVLLCLVAVASASCTGGRKVHLEFRRAQTEPADGLTAVAEPVLGSTIYIHPDPELTEADVEIARLVLESGEADPVVELEFTADGARKFGELTERQKGKWVAVLLDGRVVSAPKVVNRVTGPVQITGKFTPDEAERLVRTINTN